MEREIYILQRLRFLVNGESPFYEDYEAYTTDERVAQTLCSLVVVRDGKSYQAYQYRKSTNIHIERERTIYRVEFLEGGKHGN